ncbi:conserved hypothetical protein [Ricinus communis]|uniref:Uncharacterized protein n=1 Tax=Ricinus communis TaxID=3988 RepID=B9SML5_RICCO|nr:conserved hypothetical protein [Ricinus communis]
MRCNVIQDDVPNVRMPLTLSIICNSNAPFQKKYGVGCYRPVRLIESRLLGKMKFPGFAGKQQFTERPTCYGLYNIRWPSSSIRRENENSPGKEESRLS